MSLYDFLWGWHLFSLAKKGGLKNFAVQKTPWKYFTMKFVCISPPTSVCERSLMCLWFITFWTLVLGVNQNEITKSIRTHNGRQLAVHSLWTYSLWVGTFHKVIVSCSNHGHNPERKHVSYVIFRIHVFNMYVKRAPGEGS